MSEKRKNQDLAERDKEGNKKVAKLPGEEHEQINTNVTTNPDISMVTVPLEECTPLAAIPGSFSLTSPGLGVECAVVVVGEYYYSHKTKSIEKRTAKRKRGGVSTDIVERNIKWKAGPDPKENVIQDNIDPECFCWR
jgi:hypothetical protein